MNEEKEVIAKVVSVKTGEVLDDICYGDRVIHPNKDREIYYDYNKDKRFVKLYGGVSALRKYLTPVEFTIAISLSDFVSYEDCILRKGGHHNGKILGIHELAELMDMNYHSLRRVMYSLNNKGVIAICKIGCKDKPSEKVTAIVVNPDLFMRGVDVNKTALGLFENSNWLAEDLEESKWKDL